MDTTTKQPTDFQQATTWLQAQPFRVQDDVRREARIHSSAFDTLLGRGSALGLTLLQAAGEANLNFFERYRVLNACYKYGYRNPAANLPLDPVNMVVRARELTDPRFLDYIEQRAAQELALQMIASGRIRLELKNEYADEFEQVFLRYSFE